jgi:hypothetical protein
MKWLALLALAACGTAVDVEPVLDYQSWGPPTIVTGEAPGHADSYRAIYINDLARDGTQSFVLGYQEGSIIVKEIRDNNNGAPGDLRYVAIMRRVGEISKALENKGGWLFTQASDVTATEKEFDLCWSRCHVAAPYNGAWYDYRE